MLDSSAFPIGPLELAGPSGDERHMVTIHRLHPPEEEGKVGTMEEVRSLVPQRGLGKHVSKPRITKGNLEPCGIR